MAYRPAARLRLPVGNSSVRYTRREAPGRRDAAERAGEERRGRHQGTADGVGKMTPSKVASGSTLGDQQLAHPYVGDASLQHQPEPWPALPWRS